MRDVRSVVPLLRDEGVAVLAINADEPATRARFARETGANFPLLSDPGLETIRAYGALGESGLPLRVTVVIGPDGTVQGVDREVGRTIRAEGDRRVSRYSEDILLLFSDWDARLGSRVPRFFVPDARGRSVSPGRGGEVATVILVEGDTCEGSALARRSLASLLLNPTYRDAAFFSLVVPNGPDPARLAERPEPVVTGCDTGGGLARRLSVTATPTVIVLDRTRRVVYRGPAALERSGTVVDVVRVTLDSLLLGRAVPAPELPVVGTPVRGG